MAEEKKVGLPKFGGLSSTTNKIGIPKPGSIKSANENPDAVSNTLTTPIQNVFAEVETILEETSSSESSDLIDVSSEFKKGDVISSDLLAGGGLIDDAWDDVSITDGGSTLGTPMDALLQAVDKDESTVPSISDVKLDSPSGSSSGMNIPKATLPAPQSTASRAGSSSVLPSVPRSHMDLPAAPRVGSSSVLPSVPRSYSDLPAAPRMNSSSSLPSASRSHMDLAATSKPTVPAAAAIQPDMLKQELLGGASAPAPAPAPAPVNHVSLAKPAEEVEAEPEMTEEEQFQAILDSMSPEERAEYEAHLAQQEHEAIEARRAKQRELQEMYGSASAIQQNNSKTPIGLILGLVIGIGAIVGVLALIFTSEPEQKPEDAAEAQNNEPVAVEIPRAELSYYPVSVNISRAEAIFVNGVRISGSQGQFVRGRTNTVMAYGDGMVPYFKTFEKNEEVSRVEATLESDSLYTKGGVEFRLEEPASDITASLDGRHLSGFPMPLSSVVLGFPHVLVVERPGYHKHMQIFWPDEDPSGKGAKTVVKVPELKSEADPLYYASCTIKKFPQSGTPYGVKITTGEETYNQPVVAKVIPGDMVEYYVTREGRKSVQVAVVPDGLGSFQLDTSLLYEPKGEVTVVFNNTDKDSNVKACVRRVGEVYCTEPGQEMVVPSGNNWEIIGIVGEDGRKLNGNHFQVLYMGKRYVFEYSVDSHNTFKVKPVEIGDVKK